MKLFMLFFLAIACNASEKDYFLKNPYTGPTPTPGHCIMEVHRQHEADTTITGLNSECHVEYLSFITGSCPFVRQEILLERELKVILVYIAPLDKASACYQQTDIPHGKLKLCRILLSLSKTTWFNLEFWPREEPCSTVDWSI